MTSRRILKAWFGGLFVAAHRSADYWLGWWVIIGTIPIGVFGLLFKDEIRTGARNLWLIAIALIVFSAVIAAAEYYGRQMRRVEQLTWKDSIIVGLAQCLALVPGVSRSGATISAGLFLGMDRELAARFGFLLAIPAVFASGLFSLPDAFHPVGEGMSASGPQLLVGDRDRLRRRIRGGRLVPALPGAAQHVLVRRLPRAARHRRADPAGHRGGVGGMTVILLRHGRSTSNTAGTLAGRSEGVDLDDKGREQAQAVVGRIGTLPIRAIVCSPLLRCERTVEPLASALGLDPIVDERISEVDYGSWTGRKIGDLVKEPLWAVVQQQPSAAVFPDGEGLAAVQARAVAAVREHDRLLAEQHDGDVLWLACTHGDVIKAIVADALGTHLDSFQRITADPAAMSVIRYTSVRPFVIHVNHTGDQLTAGLVAKPPKDASKSDSKDDGVPPEDAVVGGSDRLAGARPGLRLTPPLPVFWRCHGPRNSRFPNTRPLRGRDRRATRKPDLLSAGGP